MKIVNIVLTLTVYLLVTASISGSSETQREKQIVKIMKTFNTRHLSDKRLTVVAKAIIAATQNPSCRMPWDTLLSVSYAESEWASDPKGSPDAGIMQFNRITIQKLGLDRHKLLVDTKYSVLEGCKLLTKIKVKYSKRTKHWMGIYNAGVKLEREIVIKNAEIYHNKIRKINQRIHTNSQQIQYLARSN